MTSETKTIRLYEHPDMRARVEGGESEASARGWDYRRGDVILVDGERHVLVTVRDSIQTGDVAGNYVLADAIPAPEAIYALRWARSWRARTSGSESGLDGYFLSLEEARAAMRELRERGIFPRVTPDGERGESLLIVRVTGRGRRHGAHVAQAVCS